MLLRSWPLATQILFEQRKFYLLCTLVVVGLSYHKTPQGKLGRYTMNMQAIGKKISALRKERDMTQVDLADKLGVTYQAVSSWERGNSMPDIAKLPDISQVLAVSIDELLDNAKATEIVKNVLSGQETSAIVADLETLVDVAPILKPSQVNTLAKQTSSAKGETKTTVTADMLVQLAQHMDSDNLKEIILQSDNIENSAIIEIACYMESEDLKEVALHCDKITSETITEIACHMESEDLKEIALHSDKIANETIMEIACHMESEDLKDVVLHCDDITSETITEIACHMDSEDLKEAALHCDKITSETIIEIACHMDSEDLKEVVLHCDKITSETIIEIACHMDSEDLKEVALHCDKITNEAILEIACHMDSEDLKEIIMQRKNND